MTIVTDEPEPASLESQLGSQRGDRYDLALDDGTYFACEIAFNGRVGGLASSRNIPIGVRPFELSPAAPSLVEGYPDGTACPTSYVLALESRGLQRQL